MASALHRLRDTQRQRVYRAERTIDHTPWLLHEPMRPTPAHLTNEALSDLIDGLRNGDPGGTYTARIRERRAWFKAEESRSKAATGRRVRDVAAVLLTSEWWASVGGPAKVSVNMSTSRQSSRGGMYAKGWGVRFANTPYLSNGLVVAHELAHVLAFARAAVDPTQKDPGHGPIYCGLFVSCTSALLGVDAGNELLRAFLHGDVLVGDRLSTLGVPEVGLIPAQFVATAPPAPVAAVRPRFALAACTAPQRVEQIALF